MFESQLVKADTTAVKLLSKCILAGIGNFLIIFDEYGNFVKKVKIFNGQKIHGIEVNKELILLCGGCFMQTLEFQLHPLKFVTLCSKRINDWILSARCLKNNIITCINMNNVLEIYDKNLNLMRQITCQERCILYSARIILDEVDEMVILSGTVFAEILIWKASPNQDENISPVLTRLKGHKGVIFSLSYNKKSGYICSSSDDRSSILWSVENRCIHKELKQTTPEICLSRKFYGHQSRVFRSMVLDNVLITGGEDSCVNVWNFEGELLRKIATQGPVWALDCNGDSIVAGGGSCGVLLSSMTCNHPIIERLTLPENHIPKRIAFLHSENMIVMSEEGTLYYWIRGEEEWSRIEQSHALGSYNLLEISTCGNLVSISGYHGEIHIYREKNNSIELLTAFRTKETEESRICSFHWLSCITFLTCDEKGVVILWYIRHDQVIFITSFRLPLVGKNKEAWSTAACQSENGRYVLGDRRGNIYVYELRRSSPIQTFKRIHNHLGITQLKNFNGRIVSLGRDGTVKTFLSKSEGIEAVSSDRVPFTWLAAFVDGMLLSFSGNKFIVYDYGERKVLFEHVCGGGHRSWDFQKKEDAMNFAYVKDCNVNIVRFNEKQFRSVNLVPDYHVGTVNSMCIIKSVGDRYVMLSGGEDTHLRISILGKDYFLPLNNYKYHLSSIRIVCTHWMSKDCCLLFSAGGRGQIICWKFQLHKDIEDSVCSQESAYYQVKNEQLSGSEIRIMDMKIVPGKELMLFAATSDGNIDVFRVRKETKYEMHLMTRFCHKVKCVSKIQILEESRSANYMLISMSTDGIFAFWNIPFRDIENERIIPFHITKVHQSAIVGCSCRFINQDIVLFISGGDDGCIVSTLFKLESDERGVKILQCVSQHKDVSSHCAQVTGIWISDDCFLTTGIDQKLSIFKWDIDKNYKVCCKILAKYDSAIADIQGLECVENSDCFHVFLYGKGVEYVKVTKNVSG